MKTNMKTKRDTSVEEYKLVGTFESLRKTLLRDKYEDRMEKSLAYWALPSDRRLPLAFMGRTLKNLLATPFDDLLATPGVGQKKIAALMTLLSRATKDTPPEDPYGIDQLKIDQLNEDEASNPGDSRYGSNGLGFNPSIVSEALWTQWRDTVVRHGLGQMKLGRLASTLQALPTVIWHTNLSEYIDRSLAEIRQLKTHGEKRVRAVLEVFWVVHEAFADSTGQLHLDLDLVPRFVRPVEHWIATTVESTETPLAQEIRSFLAEPLIAQIEVDAGQTVWQLAADRLGVNGKVQTVRHQSRQMGVTRARVYQLLEDCGKVMAVRWPEGEHLLAALDERFQNGDANSESARLYRSMVDLFFPKNHEPVQVLAGRIKVESVLPHSMAQTGEPII